MQRKYIKMSHIYTLEYYTTLVKAYAESSKDEKVPFDPTVMLKIIKNFKELLTINSAPPYNFYNLLYLIMEEQEQNGFRLSSFLKKIIRSHRKRNPVSPEMIINQFVYIEIIRQLKIEN